MSSFATMAGMKPSITNIGGIILVVVLVVGIVIWSGKDQHGPVEPAQTDLADTVATDPEELRYKEGSWEATLETVSAQWNSRDIVNKETDYDGYPRLMDLKPGQQIGVFTVESNESNTEGKYIVQLRGEKIVRGRYYVLGPKDDSIVSDWGYVCFHLDEPFASLSKRRTYSSFCDLSITPDEFGKDVPAENDRYPLFIKMRIADPVLGPGPFATILEILEFSNNP